MSMYSRFEHLKIRHRGERGIIGANGPSLNHVELGFLRRETVFGLNRIFLGFRQFDFYPRYFVAVNDKVIQQAVSEIRALNCVKFISQRNSALLPENALTYHMNTGNPAVRFSHDIEQGVHEGWTVTYAALQVAYYLSFSEVIIIGMAHHYEYSGAPNESRRLDGPNPNHFSPDYFGGGQVGDNPDLARADESYRIAKLEFEKDGRRILDATVDGACAVCDKVDYRRIFELNS